jgi:hypothetical protein
MMLRGKRSSMDAPAGCHKYSHNVLHHLTCSTCCCCGPSADEVNGHMQGHRGQGKQTDNHNCSKLQGLWAVLKHFHYSLHKPYNPVVAGTLPHAGAFGIL